MASGHNLTNVSDIVKHMKLQRFMGRIEMVEYVICEEGRFTQSKLDQVTGRLEPTSCFISIDILSDCLLPSIGDSRSVAAVITCNGHSVCISRKGDVYSFFDPSPSLFCLSMTREELYDIVAPIVVEQSDVTVFRHKCAK